MRNSESSKDRFRQQDWSKLSIPSPADKAQVWLCAISPDFFAISADSLLGRQSLPLYASGAINQCLPKPPAYNELGPGRLRVIKLPASSITESSSCEADVAHMLQKNWAATSRTAGDSASHQLAGPHMLLWSGGGLDDMTLNVSPFQNFWQYLTSNRLLVLVSIVGAFHEANLQLLLVPTRLPYTSNPECYEELVAAWFIPVKAFALPPVDACMPRWRQDMRVYLLEEMHRRHGEEAGNSRAAGEPSGDTPVESSSAKVKSGGSMSKSVPRLQQPELNNSMDSTFASMHKHQVSAEMEMQISQEVAGYHADDSVAVLKVLYEHLKACTRRLKGAGAIKWQDTMKRYPDARQGLPNVDEKLSLAPGLHLGQCWPPLAYINISYTRPPGDAHAPYAPQQFHREFFKSCDCAERGRMCSGPEVRKRLVQLQQHGVQHKFEIRSMPNMGWGVFAKELIEEEELIATYTGQVLRGYSLVAQQEAQYAKMRWHYTFSPFPDGEDNGQHAIVDATFMGNLTRFINHHCDPNCDVVLVCQPDDEAHADDADDDAHADDADEEPHTSPGSDAGSDMATHSGEHMLGIQAKRRIQPGEQLSILYQAHDDSHTDLSRVPAHMRCYCGAANCRGWMFWIRTWDCHDDDDDLATLDAPVGGLAIKTVGVGQKPTKRKRARSKEGSVASDGSDVEQADRQHASPEGIVLQGQHASCMYNSAVQCGPQCKGHNAAELAEHEMLSMQPSNASTSSAAAAAGLADTVHTSVCDRPQLVSMILAGQQQANTCGQRARASRKASSPIFKRSRLEGGWLGDNKPVNTDQNIASASQLGSGSTSSYYSGHQHTGQLGIGNT